MACVQIPDLPLERFARETLIKWRAERVPLGGSMELDLRCNLRCHHCYRDGEWPPGILTTEEVTHILDQIAGAGTLWLLFTGGEIFLRKDFFDIYDHARRLGFKLSLFTNGTTITEKIADRLAESPPYMIEITLYGYTRETYEKVTGVPGSRDKCYRGVALLLERNVPLRLKTMVMRTNEHEFIDVMRFAESRGLDFKWDTAVQPNLDGSLTPCKVRLSPKEAVDIDISVPHRVEEYRKFYERNPSFSTDKLFGCGAGRQTFHIDPYGKMTMCLLLRKPDFSLKEFSFQQIWNEMFPPVYSRMRRPDHLCNSCELVTLCGKCPAWSQLEKGDMEARVEWACEYARRLAQRLGFYSGTLDSYTGAAKGSDNEIALPVLQEVGG